MQHDPIVLLSVHFIFYCHSICWQYCIAINVLQKMSDMICFKALLSCLYLTLAGGLFRICCSVFCTIQFLAPLACREPRDRILTLYHQNPSPTSSLPLNRKVHFWLLFPALQTMTYFSFHIDWLYFSLISCLPYWSFLQTC